MGFNPVSDRIATIRLQCKPVNMTVLQVYAPTSTAEEEVMEEFYEKVQNVVDDIPRGDVLYVIGDWNAKVGQDETNGTTGRFGLGERNERGDQLVELWGRIHEWGITYDGLISTPDITDLQLDPSEKSYSRAR